MTDGTQAGRKAKAWKSDMVWPASQAAAKALSDRQERMAASASFNLARRCGNMADWLCALSASAMPYRVAARSYFGINYWMVFEREPLRKAAIHGGDWLVKLIVMALSLVFDAKGARK